MNEEIAHSRGSSREVIVRSERWDAAVRFYEIALAFPVVHRGETLVGFDSGAFAPHVEKGTAHGAVFDFLAPENPYLEAPPARRRLHARRRRRERAAPLPAGSVRPRVQPRHEGLGLVVNRRSARGTAA